MDYVMHCHILRYQNKVVNNYYFCNNNNNNCKGLIN